jgi:hypothetical protein
MLESYCSMLIEPVARFNVQKLIRGKFKPADEAEALQEIENQLRYVDRRADSGQCWKTGGKAVFVHFELLKASKGLS